MPLDRELVAVVLPGYPARPTVRKILERLATWEGLNAGLALAFASRFLFAHNSAIDSRLFVEFARVVDSGMFWAVFFTIVAAMLFVATHLPLEYRVGVRLLLIMWWGWLTLFLGEASTDVLTFRFACVLIVFAGLEFGVFLIRQLERLKDAN